MDNVRTESFYTTIDGKRVHGTFAANSGLTDEEKVAALKDMLKAAKKGRTQIRAITNSEAETILSALKAVKEYLQEKKKQSHGVISLRSISRNLLPDYFFPLKITCKIMHREH